jgi:hypothetical protein
MISNTTTSSDSRSNEEGDWIAQQFFSPADLQISPEEYAARHAHEWGPFSFHLYRYRDRALGAWVQRLGEILSNEGELDRCRQRFLTPEELERVREQEAEDL